MKHIIKRTNGEIIIEGEFDSVSDDVQTAVKQFSDLHGAYLRGADLHAANLREANLRGADLHAANLREANLYRADLSGADLSEADFRGAYLNGANLSGAHLSGANLSGANLSEANLREANLREANLSGAHLSGANLSEAKLSYYSIVPEEGEFIAWKKLKGSIAKLKIPADAQRVSTPIGRKCRASKAVVLDIYGGIDCVSIYDETFRYVVGQTVVPDSFDANPYVECSYGIHFFITREEAENY